MDYMLSKLAQMEHEERIRSMWPVPEYQLPLKARQPNRVLRLARRLLYVLGSQLMSLGAGLQPEPIESSTSPALK